MLIIESISVIITAQAIDTNAIERTLAQNKLFRETPFASINLKLVIKEIIPRMNININAIKSLLPAETPDAGNK
jgi:hypothetical protein